MWEYWKDKYGVLEALERYPDVPLEVVALKAVAEAALASIDSIMMQRDPSND